MDPIISLSSNKKIKFDQLTKIINLRSKSVERKIVNQFFRDEGVSNEALNGMINDYYNYINSQNIKEIDTLKQEVTLSQQKIKKLELKNQLLVELWKSGTSIQILDVLLQFERF